MGCRITAIRRPKAFKIPVTRRVVWDLPAPVRTAPMLTTGTRATSVVAPGPSSTKLAPAAMAMEPTCMTCSCETSL